MSSLTILLADDDQDDMELFEEAVAKVDSKIELMKVEDGRELMSLIQTLSHPPPPHIIFLDINMPFKNGMDCLKEIRKNPSFDDVPIIIFSTSISPEHVQASFKNGASMYLSKYTFFRDDVIILKKLISTNWLTYLSQPFGNKFLLG